MWHMYVRMQLLVIQKFYGILQYIIENQKLSYQKKAFKITCQVFVRVYYILRMSKEATNVSYKA